MKFSAVLALISAVAAAALPTVDESNLVTRANDVANLPTKSCRCGGSVAGAATYAAGDIKKAADLSLDYIIQNKQIGKGSLPT